MKDNNQQSQIISIDIGRGYLKGYTEYNNEKLEFKCKSVIGDSRNIDINEYTQPIYLEIGNRNYFVGEIAEKESHNSIKNTRDSKTSTTAETLLVTALNALAKTEQVKVMLGVPYDCFTKSQMVEIKGKYKGKEYIVKDKINNSTRRIFIEDINIYREADASMFYIVKNKNNTKPIGVINAGFKTTELAYYDKGYKFNDLHSMSMNYGCQNALSLVQEQLRSDGIKKELNEIDSSTDYDNQKQEAFDLMSEKISQKIEEIWLNIKEMDVFVTGGNALNMKIDERFTLVDDCQMTTAKGLYLVGKEIYN